MGGYLGHNDHVVECEIVGEKIKAIGKTFALRMGREDFGLLKELACEVPGNLPLKILVPINASNFLRDIC